MGKLVVISGLPASGKSTIIKAIKEQHDVIIVPEHNEWVKGKFPKVPENIEEKIEKQRFFLNLDIERYKWAMAHKNEASIIISDTDFTSPLAHNYAERWLFPEFNIYDWMVDEYTSKIKGGELGLADYYIYVDVTFEERQKRRAEDFEKTARKRNEMFFTEPFPTNMRRFHDITMNESSKRKCLPASWYFNDKTKDEAINDVWNIINNKSDNKKYDEDFFKILKETINDQP